LAAAAAVADAPVGKAPAASGSESKAYKIGVVNRKEVFDAYTKTKTEYETLQQEVDGRQKKVDALSTQIDDQKKEYDGKKDSMTETERDEFKAKVESDYRQYRGELDRMQRDIDSMELRVVKKLFGDIDRAIARVGAEGGYHLVLDGTPKDTPGSVIYYSPTLNMTQKVIDYINSHDVSEPE
jgi:Skp family chaperone for outer membrane proteins